MPLNADQTTESTATSAFIPINPSAKLASTTSAGAYVPLGTTGSPITKPTAGTFVVSTTISDGTMVVAATVTGTLNPSEPLLFTATGSDIPGGTMVITKTGPILAGSTTSANDSAGKADDTEDLGKAPADSFAAHDGSFTIVHYVLGTYFPTLLAVIYGIFWNTILAGIAKMMPFFQLTRPGGATAAESLLLENVGLWGLLVGSKHRNGLVLAGTLVTAMVTATIALASEIFYIGISGTCRETGNGADCTRYLGINRRLAWAASAMLVLVLAIMAFLIVAVRRRSSGIFAEATSIAGVATLLSNPTVVTQLREALDHDRKHGASSGSATFSLGQSYDPGVGWTYGLTLLAPPTHSADSKAAMLSAADDSDDDNNNDATTTPSAPTTTATPLLLHPATLITFQLLLLALLSILLYYYFNGAPSPLENFLNSQTLGPKLMMSCFGIAIRTWWSEIARAVHALEPARRLALGQATAHESVLAPTTTPHAVWAIGTALGRRHRFVAGVAALSVLSEVLIVTLAAVPFNLATLLEAFQVSVFVSVGILGVMFGTVPVLLVRYWGGVAVAPPACVGDTVGLVVGRGNEVVRAMAGMGGLGGKERDEAVEGLRRRYRLVGLGGGEVGRVRVAFEREEGEV